MRISAPPRHLGSTFSTIMLSARAGDRCPARNGSQRSLPPNHAPGSALGSRTSSGACACCAFLLMCGCHQARPQMTQSARYLGQRRVHLLTTWVCNPQEVPVPYEVGGRDKILDWLA